MDIGKEKTKTTDIPEPIKAPRIFPKQPLKEREPAPVRREVPAKS